MQEPKRRIDDYGPNEMAIPEWRTIQKVGGDLAKEQGAEPGQFYNSILDEAANELNIIVVDILSGRSRWGTEITSSGPICFSVNAKSNRSANNDDCFQCEYRLDTPWSVDASERRKMCCLNYTILGIDVDHDNLPIIIRSHGVSAMPARQLITQLRMNRSLKGEYHKAVVNIKNQEKDTPYGTTYVMRPKIIRLITDEVVAEELKIESQRLLGSPIPLPEGRPEEEDEPLGFTPLETPYHSEEEGGKIMTQETRKEEMRRKRETVETEQRKKQVEVPTSEIPEEDTTKEMPREEVKEKTSEEEIDLNF